MNVKQENILATFQKSNVSILLAHSDVNPFQTALRALPDIPLPSDVLMLMNVWKEPMTVWMASSASISMVSMTAEPHPTPAPEGSGIIHGTDDAKILMNVQRTLIPVTGKLRLASTHREALGALTESPFVTLATDTMRSSSPVLT